MRKRELTIDLNEESSIEIKNLAVFSGSIEVNGSGNKITGVLCLFGSSSRGVVKGFRSGAQSVYIKGGENNTIKTGETLLVSASGIVKFKNFIY